MNAADLLLPALTVDEVRESLSMTQKGQTANTIGNCKTVFQRDPLLKGAIRLNLLTEPGNAYRIPATDCPATKRVF